MTAFAGLIDRLFADPNLAVDATYERLVAAGYHGHKSPWDAEWGQRYALIHDPDGNTIELKTYPS